MTRALPEALTDLVLDLVARAHARGAAGESLSHVVDSCRSRFRNIGNPHDFADDLKAAGFQIIRVQQARRSIILISI